MTRKTAIALLLCCTMLVTTSCWSRRELNQLSITVGLGIDRIEGKYVVSAQVVDPAQVSMVADSAGTRLPITVYSESGDSIMEALRRMTTVAPRRIYLSHLRIVVIGESLARYGLNEALDYLSRKNEARTDFYVTIAKGHRAMDILNMLTPLEKIPANNLYNSLDTSARYWAPTHGIFLDELIDSLGTEGKSPILTGIDIVQTAPLGKAPSVTQATPPLELQYEGIAVFRKDKLIGWLNEDQSKGFNYIQGFVKKTVGHIKCPDGSGLIATDIIRSETRVTPSIVDGKPEIRVRVFAEGNIAEIACEVDLLEQNVLRELESKVNKTIEGLIRGTVNRAQNEFKTDFLGFGAKFHQSYPKQWAVWKDDWDDIFSDMKVNIEIDYRLRRVGTIINPLGTEKKEGGS